MAIPYKPTSNTKLLYHMEGGSTDSSGNGNNGVDAAVKYGLSYGKFNQGAYFDSGTSSISFTTTNFPTGSNSFTLSAWFNPQALPAVNGYLIVYGAVANDQAVGMALRGVTSNRIRAIYFGNDLDYIITIPTDTWHNMMCTYDGTTLKIYLDATMVNSALRSANVAAGALHFIGGDGADTTRMNGYIDEVIVENRTWSQAEITAYYNESLYVNPPMWFM